MLRKAGDFIKTRHCRSHNVLICQRYFSGVYLHVEFPTFIPMDELDWKQINVEMRKYQGLISKTWLSGINNDTVGGFYEFETKENAENYVENYLKKITEETLNVKGKYTIYSKDATKKQSIEMNSPYFYHKQEKKSSWK